MTQRRVKNTATSNSDPEAADVELYMSPDGAISLPVRVEGDTVWATQAQMAELFGVDRDTGGVHLRNAYDEAELDREATTEDFSVEARDHTAPHRLAPRPTDPPDRCAAARAAAVSRCPGISESNPVQTTRSSRTVAGVSGVSRNQLRDPSLKRRE